MPRTLRLNVFEIWCSRAMNLGTGIFFLAIAAMAWTQDAKAQRSSARGDSLFQPWASSRPLGGLPGVPEPRGRGGTAEPEWQPSARSEPIRQGMHAGSWPGLPQHLQRREVDYPTREASGTVVVDTANRYLYLVLGQGRAVRYGIGVGREGFTWSGRQRVSRKAEWPDWRPPEEMLARQPDLPRFMAGGLDNPLGARALYLGDTLYRIHGTNDPSSIGTNDSSGCIRMTNEDVIDLYKRVAVGAQVVVLPAGPRSASAR